jgi:hypothetical protein
VVASLLPPGYPAGPKSITIQHDNQNGSPVPPPSPPPTLVTVVTPTVGNGCASTGAYLSPNGAPPAGQTVTACAP